MAPRNLKAPIFWKFSHLKNSSAAKRLSKVVERSTGVRVDLVPDALVGLFDRLLCYWSFAFLVRQHVPLGAPMCAYLFRLFD